MIASKLDVVNFCRWATGGYFRFNHEGLTFNTDFVHLINT
jgi:hypothetical protein